MMRCACPPSPCRLCFQAAALQRESYIKGRSRHWTPAQQQTYFTEALIAERARLAVVEAQLTEDDLPLQEALTLPKERVVLKKNIARRLRVLRQLGVEEVTEPRSALTETVVVTQPTAAAHPQPAAMDRHAAFRKHLQHDFYRDAEDASTITAPREAAKPRRRTNA